MHTSSFFAQYLFHPVGQGLFASGQIARSPANLAQAFTWVYDCGSVSSVALVRAGLDRLGGRIRRGRRVIDLLVLSHFDKDHISGVTELLTNFAVDTLVIPLVPIWQRLGMVFSEPRYIEKSVLRFYLDPVAAVASIPRADIKRIIVVPPSAGEDSPPPPRGAPDNPVPLPSLDELPEDRQGFELLAPRGLTRVAPELQPAASPAGVPPVYQLPVGAALLLAVGFEFVPYNDARLPKPPDAAFILEAQERAQALLDSSSVSGRKAALSALKRHYHQTYKNSKQRNEISLHLYAGPTTATAQCACRYAPAHGGDYQRAHIAADRAGILYTGDAYLDTPEKWRRLADYLSASRADRILSFQVMHHGASANWHSGLAAAVRSLYAVFSSDPSHKRFRHPHQVVVRDFEGWSYPVFVNKEQGLSLAMLA